MELYNLVEDPEENVNLARKEPEVVRMLQNRMEAWIARREKETGKTNPMVTNLNWHRTAGYDGPFRTSEDAYNHLHIGSARAAERLQAEGSRGGKKAKRAKKAGKARAKR